MICPECSKPMRQVPCQTPANYSGIGWEKYNCSECQLTAKVETVYFHDERDYSDTSTSNAEKP